LFLFAIIEHDNKDKGKGKGLATRYSAAYVSRPKTSSALQYQKWQLIGMS